MSPCLVQMQYTASHTVFLMILCVQFVIYVFSIGEAVCLSSF